MKKAALTLIKRWVEPGIMEPLAGIEPATYSLRVNCSTPELQRPWVGGRDLFNIEFHSDKPKNLEESAGRSS